MMFSRVPSLHKLPSSYVAMDLETTGLDRNRDGIVEIAGIRIVDGRFDGAFETLVNPGVRMSRRASDVNGITGSMLKGAPSPEAAVGGFLEFSGGLPMLGHNAVAFDRGFVEAVCARSAGLAIPGEWFDTMLIARNLYGKKLSLGALCETAGVDVVRAHRALTDAVAVHECYRWLRDRIGEETTDARDFAKRVGSGPLDGHVVCITGSSDRISRHDLMELVCRLGGEPSNNVTKKVTLLLDFAGGTTAKARKAIEYGPVTGVRTLDGNAFLDLALGIRS